MKALRVTLEQWRALQAVVDYGGFAQAAERLNRSQSSVSYAVARLQEQLGVALLVVEGRKARLTETGAVLLQRSRQLVQDAVAIEQLATQLVVGWEPEVRLVVDVALPSTLLMSVLGRFAPQSRGTRVQLREVVLSGADEALLQGAADLVIGTQVPAGFLGEELLRIEFIAVAHIDHALHRLGRELTAQDLVREVQVVVRDSGHEHPRDVGWLGGAQRWTVSGIDTAVAAIGQGLGFGWLPLHHVRDQLQQDMLRELPLREGRRYHAHLHLVFGKQQNPGAATRLLADIFRDQARGASDW